MQDVRTGIGTRMPWSAARPVGHVLVLQDGPNPSTDIYLRPRLMAPGMPPCTVVDITREHPTDHNLASAADGTRVFVVICRYIDEAWLSALERARDGLAGVAHFIDDDLPAMPRDRSLPLRYRFRIWIKFRLAPETSKTPDLWKLGAIQWKN